MNTVSVTEMRRDLGRILTRVSEGEEVTITRHGHPVAMVISPAGVRARAIARSTALAEELHAALAAARSQPLAEQGTMSTKRAEELVAAIDAGRGVRPA